jgi:hypothetical protein
MNSTSNSTLGGKVVAAGNGVHGFDTDVPLTRATAAAFRQQGFGFCVRYLSRSTPQAARTCQRARRRRSWTVACA